jgi:hypothetical protein
MPEVSAGNYYRAYVLDSEDHIVNRHDFVAKSSTAALAFAARYVDGHDVEVWLRAHIIARLKHNQ